MSSKHTARRLFPSKSPTVASRPRRAFTFRASSPYALRRQQHFFRAVVLVSSAAGIATTAQWYTGKPLLIKDVHAEAPPPAAAPEPVEVVFEQPRKPVGVSKEDTRAQISSQHLQVRKSWENPGVYCWGANDGLVAGPDIPQESIVKNPRRLPFFDDVLLRDLKLSRDFGAAITENGDLLQWGSAYDEKSMRPVVTLKDKNLKSLALSKDRIIALSRNGTVYSVSVSRHEQEAGPKVAEPGYIPFWNSQSRISYRLLEPRSLGWTESVTSIASGLEHALLLTSTGRVFSLASCSDAFPAKGQLGVPGLTWFTRPEGPYDMPHEVQALKGFHITKIATGDRHSIALDRQGRVFSWGDNARGQLGIGETSRETTFFEAPTLLPFNKLYAGTMQAPRITSIAAGGNTSFFTVDAVRIASPDSDSRESARAGLGLITADTWACGHGIWGQLGNGRWTHVQPTPTKILPLSGLFEYDEKKRRAVPIRMREISVGSNHCAAIMDNVTYVSATHDTSENDTNWGADVLFFGNNEFYQLGTGKRNNVVTPTYIQPMDRLAETQEGKRPKQEVHRFHATPRSTVRVGNRWVNFEQRIVCGRGVTAVYSGL